MKYKCHVCKMILSEEDLIDGVCPKCMIQPVEMCVEDKICECAFDISGKINYCPKCGEAVCPCGSHDTLTISRVTGYLQAVPGWNAAKQQELKDRQRYDIV